MLDADAAIYDLDYAVVDNKHKARAQLVDAFAARRLSATARRYSRQRY